MHPPCQTFSSTRNFKDIRVNTRLLLAPSLLHSSRIPRRSVYLSLFRSTDANEVLTTRASDHGETLVEINED